MKARPIDLSSMTEPTQVIPTRFGKWRRWWYEKHPIQDVCPATRWHHRWDDSWGDVTCRSCSATAYIEYGR